MQFPLSFWDVSLWLALTALILLITAELISPYYGQSSLQIKKGRLKTVAFTLCLLFLLTVLIRIFEIITPT